MKQFSGDFKQWVNRLQINSAEKVTFRWSTNELNVASAIWNLGKQNKHVLLSGKKPSKRGAFILEKREKPSKRGAVIIEKREKPSKRGVVLEDKHKGSHKHGKFTKRP